MVSTTVSIRPKTLNALKELAVSQKSSLQQVLDQAIEHFQRHRLLDQINADYAALRQDPDAWDGLQQERAAWDATLMDGLDPEETSMRGGAQPG